MPSIFSRQRTQSSPLTAPSAYPFQQQELSSHGYTDEFGRYGSGSGHAHTLGGPPIPPKKDKKDKKKKDRERDKRDEDEDELHLDEGGFLPFTALSPSSSQKPSSPKPSSSRSQTLSPKPPPTPAKPEQPYGHLSYKSHIVLSIAQLSILVTTTCAELQHRGLQVPFLFSPLAIDLSAGAVKRLVDSFLRSVGGDDAGAGTGAGLVPVTSFDEDVRFAGCHELGMVLRWGLARVLRVVGGEQQRGILDFEWYLKWRYEEEALNYPPPHILSFLSPPTPSPEEAPLPAIPGDSRPQTPFPSSPTPNGSPHPPITLHILHTLLQLFSSLTAHSSSSGLTPTTLGTLFGALLFGLPTSGYGSSAPFGGERGVSASPGGGGGFRESYAMYLGTAHAAEHLLLAFVRWQDWKGSGGSASALGGSVSGHPSAGSGGGVPPKLKAWITGYPRMLPQSREHLFAPRRGAKTRRVVAVRRNVRLYSSDLVRSGAGWATTASASAGGTNFVRVLTDLGRSKEWARIAPPPAVAPPSPGGSNAPSGFTLPPGFGSGNTQTLLPRYTEEYRKRMNLPPSFQPVTSATASSTSALGAGSLLGSPSPYTASPGSTVGTLSSSTPSLLTLNAFDENDELRFKSLTDLRWGEFESLGFDLDGDDGDAGVGAGRRSGAIGTGRRGVNLEFDLNESARKRSPSKRTTITWSDFSQTGFLKPGGGNDPLDGVLQFDKTVTDGLKENEGKIEEISRKLRKSSKQLPPFGWDTSPVMSEEIIEEGYLSIFCDIIYGGGPGWMDRSERIFREGNWALVEFKSYPNTSSPTSPRSPAHTHSHNIPLDPRSGSTLVLFEEFVPLEYRAQLSAPPKRGLRLFPPISISKSSRKWKPAPTLNGSPYVIGRVPTSGISGGPAFTTKGHKEREKEFEGLLESGASGTTLRLTSDGKREIRVGAVGGGVGKTVKGISSPLYADTGEDYPRRMERAPTFPLDAEVESQAPPDAGSTTPTPAATPVPTASPSVALFETPKKSRFRIPVPGSVGRNKGAGGFKLNDLDAVDFETRTMASSSDGSSRGSRSDLEIGNTPNDRRSHARQSSKDDAWVDILIQSRDRRIEGQDASAPLPRSQRRTIRPRTLSDPDQTRAEVARALKEAGTPPPDLPEPRGTIQDHRRGGLFEYDPGAGEEDFDEDEGVQEVDYVPQTSGKPDLNIVPSTPHDDTSYDTHDHIPDEYDETDVPHFDSEPHSPDEPTRGHVRKDSSTLPGIIGLGDPIRSISPRSETGKSRESGVSALIEMYREKERDHASDSGNGLGLARGATSGNPKPSGSRLPVRATPVPPKEKDASLPAVPLSQDPAPESAPIPVPIPAVPATIPEDPAAHQASPNRYVHGAPLHNLPEEEEEED